jgi:peptidase E
MAADAPTILATSIGFHSGGRGDLDWRPGPVYQFAAELAGAARAPRLCFVSTATGDQGDYLAATYAAFAGSDPRVSHLALFPMPNVEDVRAHLLGQDVIWVTGGSVVNLMAVWRAHGLDRILWECWQAGVVLGGTSAGSLCWHVGGTTDSFGPELQKFTDGLGWLPYSNGVHYDAELQRRPLLHRLIKDEVLPGGYATDNGVGLVYRGTELVEAVSEVDGAAAYEVTLAGGVVAETRIEPRRLTDRTTRAG